MAQIVERKEPANLEAEMNALGCGFLSKTALTKLCDDLTADMFYDERNSLIFAAMKSLHNRNENIDTTILVNEIEKNGSINKIGGLAYLSEVIDSVVSASNVESYINIVRDKALRRKLITACESIEKTARDEINDTNEIIDSAEKDIFQITKQKKSGEFKNVTNVLKTARENLEALSKQASDITGLPTGFVDFDKLTAGLHPNQLIIIAARPGMGKTAFALNVAANAAIQSGKAVAIFNLEMSAEQLIMRMISSRGAIEGGKLMTGKLNQEDWKKVNEAMSELDGLPLFFEDTPGVTIGELTTKCRRLAEKENLGLIIIDYLQLISGGSGYGNNRVQEISDVSRKLKMLAMELGIPVIALAQLSRQVEGREDKRPMMSDLRESGQIEQDADIIGFLYREDYYTKQATDTGISKSEFIIGKNRNGATKTIFLTFERIYSNFCNYIDAGNQTPED
jgi:replicative DNA helicase